MRGGSSSDIFDYKYVGLALTFAHYNNNVSMLGKEVGSLWYIEIVS